MLIKTRWSGRRGLATKGIATKLALRFKGGTIASPATGSMSRSMIRYLQQEKFTSDQADNCGKMARWPNDQGKATVPTPPTMLEFYITNMAITSRAIRPTFAPTPCGHPNAKTTARRHSTKALATIGRQ